MARPAQAGLGCREEWSEQHGLACAYPCPGGRPCGGEGTTRQRPGRRLTARRAGAMHNTDLQATLVSSGVPRRSCRCPRWGHPYRRGVTAGSRPAAGATLLAACPPICWTPTTPSHVQRPVRCKLARGRRHTHAPPPLSPCGIDPASRRLHRRGSAKACSRALPLRDLLEAAVRACLPPPRSGSGVSARVCPCVAWGMRHRATWGPARDGRASAEGVQRLGRAARRVPRRARQRGCMPGEPPWRDCGGGWLDDRMVGWRLAVCSLAGGPAAAAPAVLQDLLASLGTSCLGGRRPMPRRIFPLRCFCLPRPRTPGVRRRGLPGGGILVTAEPVGPEAPPPPQPPG